MQMTLRSTLAQLKIDLAAYYAADFAGDRKDSRQNRALRGRMRELILAAYAVQDFATMNGALEVLSQSTGCADDYLIFVDITDELMSKNIITIDTTRALLQGSPLQSLPVSRRWQARRMRDH